MTTRCLVLLVSFGAASTVRAQPVDDPGIAPSAPAPAAQPSQLAPDPPPAPRPPAPVVAPAPAPARPAAPPTAPKPTEADPMKFAPRVSAPPPAEVQETVESSVTTSAPPTERDLYQSTVPTSVFGPIGLLRTITGDGGGKNTFRIALHLGGFRQDNFVIAPGVAGKGDTNGHFAGNLVINYSPIQYLELYLALFSTTNENTRTDAGRTDPSLILALGDLQLGFKGRLPVRPYMDLALHFGVKFLSSSSTGTFSGDSTNVAVDAVASWDLRHIRAHVPLRFHANIGFLYDNSLALLPSGQCASSVGDDPCIRSRVVETFAYGVGTSRVRMALAADLPLLIRTVGFEPIFEYHLDASVGSGDSVVAKALKGVVSSDRLSAPIAQYLTIGMRLRPIPSLVLDAGIDVGLQSPGFQYGPPVPGWNLMAGAQYAYDRSAVTRREVVTRTVTREIARATPSGRIRGVVRDAKTNKPVPRATVRYLNKHETSQVTSEEATFVSYQFQPGTVQMEVSRDDYEPVTTAVTTFANGETPIEVRLQPKPPAAGLVRTRLSAPAGVPVGATVRFVSTAGAVVDAEFEGSGAFTAKLLPGDYQLSAMADGHLARERLVMVEAGQVLSLEVALAKKPAVAHVSLAENEIRLKGQVQFTAMNELKPESQPLLDEIIDLLVRTPAIKKLRIEGHVDNRGDAQKNVEATRSRAMAVQSYLVKQGVDPTRLEAEGYGGDQPLVPNLTPANRAKNRRMTFKIVAQGDALQHISSSGH
jgi:outer membrane protein OmpA-like peptidoglycan-associated protein